MVKYRTAISFLISVNILTFLADAASNDICESCKPIEECPQFGDMTREQQKQWNRDFPCGDPRSRNTVPGFSKIAKGDYVCCPGSNVWGIEGNSQGAEGQNSASAPNNYNVNNYPFYNPNQPKDNSFGGLQNGFYNSNNNYNNDQCSPQESPPNPESGCCGVDTFNFKITDLQQFLRSKDVNANWRSQSNYPRFQRKARQLEEPALDVDFESRIAGGRQADLDQFPWTVFLSVVFLNNNMKANFVCGGSLISSRFVLSAAHCFITADNGYELLEVEVTLAEYDRRTFPRDCVTISGQSPICIDNLKVSADTVITHPNYSPRYLINDIALVRLIDTVPYTRYIRPICLPPIDIDSPQFANLPLATAGWGLNITVQSDVKQFTVVRMVPKSECKTLYPLLTDGHLCASGDTTEDTCKGDSGGPLMMMYQSKYYIVGIVSGKTAQYQCGTPVPSLYTSVFQYLDWIRSYTG